jgi:hypothetical protein
MSHRWSTIARRGSVIALLAVSTGALAQDAGPPVVPVALANLCVTEGQIDQLPGRQLGVAVPAMRAVTRAGGGQAVELRFRYLGITAQTDRLGSGELRQQLGLKLRAQDACNLVYAMWRIAPEPGLVISVKSNPDRHTSAQCGNQGYRNVTPRPITRGLPALRAGEMHRLRADIAGTALRVQVDGRVVWEGDLGESGVPAEGPVGMRSDNARFETAILAEAAPASQRPAPCRPGERED